MQGDGPRPAAVPPGRPGPGEDSAPGAPSQEGTRVASSRWNQGCMRCPAGKRRQGGRRGGRGGGCRLLGSRAGEAARTRPPDAAEQAELRPSSVGAAQSPGSPPHGKSPRCRLPPVWTKGLGPPGAGAEAQQNRAELTIVVRVTQEARRRDSARSLRGGRSLPVKRVWRRGLERGDSGPRWDARRPGEPSEHRARDRTPWGKRDCEGGAAHLPASPSGSEPGEGRRPASRWSVEGCGIHVRRPSLRREAPGPDRRAGRLGGAAGLRTGAVQAGAWEGRRPRAAEGRPPHPWTPLHGAPHPLPPSSLPFSCRRATVSGARGGGAQRPCGGRMATPSSPTSAWPAACLPPSVPATPARPPCGSGVLSGGPRIEWSERLVST